MLYSLDYYLFYKPYQTLCQFSEEKGKKTLADYISEVKKNVYPVGRLDYDSEGLILLTNDKRVNNAILHPDYKLEKEYWVQVEGIPDEHAIQELRNGVKIKVNGKSYTTLPSKVKKLTLDEAHINERSPPIRFRKNIPTCWLSIILNEGKNRQVRKMTASVGFPTLRLIRYRIDNYTIDNMQPGDLQRIDAIHLLNK